ncbi:hypothetical protein Mal48_26240 [Thalassoglobus polymorphus]|uniref:Uncharacterized protein n=1 Tax=Thalassoglobus polymorphus TaxID=2527994 RepID=A0A517QP24_9PLAN|nr:hypothetical protein Mal48_26240 [Thalassoglobus polymorphus]
MNLELIDNLNMASQTLSELFLSEVSGELLELVSKLAVHFSGTEKGHNSIGFETASRLLRKLLFSSGEVLGRLISPTCR